MVSSGMEKGKLNELHCRIQDNEVNLADIEERMNKARIRKVQICKDLEKKKEELVRLEDELERKRASQGKIEMELLICRNTKSENDFLIQQQRNDIESLYLDAENATRKNLELMALTAENITHLSMILEVYIDESRVSVSSTTQVPQSKIWKEETSDTLTIDKDVILAWTNDSLKSLEEKYNEKKITCSKCGGQDEHIEVELKSLVSEFIERIPKPSTFTSIPQSYSTVYYQFSTQSNSSRLTSRVSENFFEN